MFCTRPLSWVKRACLDGPLTTLLTKSRAAALTVNMDQRSSSYLTSRAQRAANLQIGWIARRPVYKVFEARCMMSPVSDFQKRFASLVEPWNCYHDEMLELIRKESALVVDVRRADELKATGVMYGACNIPLDELKTALNLPKDKFKKKYGCEKPNPDGSNVVFTCRSGRRSLQAIEIAKESGYTKARHYPGGWIGWVEKSKL